MQIKGFNELHIDSFPKRPTATPTLLISHSHLDHVKGIPKTMQHVAYCSGATARSLRRLGFTRIRFRIIPWNSPTLLELSDGTRAVVTMFPVDHNCDGAAGFIVEELGQNRRRILYTGDLKFSERWWEQMEDFGYWNDTFDDVYLDGTFWLSPHVTSEMTAGHSTREELGTFMKKLGRDWDSCINISTLRL